MRFLIILLLSLIGVLLLKADMTPKFSETFEIQFLDSNSKSIELDSFVVISNLGYKKDSACYPKSFCSLCSCKDENYTEKYWTGVTINKLFNTYEVFCHSFIENFSLIVYSKSLTYRINDIKNFSACKIYKFQVSNKLTDVSNILHNSWNNYLVYLLLTIFIEICVYSIYTRKDRSNIPLIQIIILNSITHYCLWFILSHSNISVLLMEFIVILIEFIFWYKVIDKSNLDYKYYMKLSIYSNLVSWLFGMIFSFG